MRELTYLKVLLSVVLLPIAIIGVINYFVDPLQYYHKAYFHSSYSENQRQQNPGLARNYSYDTVVIGTSHTENFIPTIIKEELGFNALKLSMSGATAYEQKLILNIALETNQVQNVIWGLEVERFLEGINAVSMRNGGFPAHFYSGGIDPVFNYLLSYDSLRLSLDAIKSKNNLTLDELNVWYDKHEFSSRAVEKSYNTYCNLIKTKGVSSLKGLPQGAADIEKSVRQNVQKIIEENPDVNFFVFYPPASLAKYVFYKKYLPEKIEQSIKFKRDVYDLIGNYSNVQIYDFQDVVPIVSDLNYFKDLSHYSLDVNKYILNSMKQGRHKYKNIELTEGFEKFTGIINGYNLPFDADC